MSLFGRSKPAKRTGPPPAEMRGRAAEIDDAGVFEWDVIWEALKTEPPDESSSTLTQELGLGEEQEITQDSDMPATEFSGTRNGRRVAVRIGVVASAWRGKAANEVQVEASVAPFSVSDDGGRLVAEPGAPAELAEFLSGLTPAPDVWREVEVAGGTDGIVARRPVTAHNQGYVYDLWLAERLADRLAA